MRTLAHISDVHFGREDPEIVGRLLAAIEDARPDVIVVSGDLTQRAKKRQFRAARAFLRDLPKVPRIVVPGNHDVSATNLLERAIRPLSRYRRFITSDLQPFYEDGEIAVAGINTVRVGAVKNGRINTRQMRTVCEQLGRADANSTRIVVMHHPIDLAADDGSHAIVGRAAAAMREFARCRVDLFLSGHLHSGVTISTRARYPLPGYSAIVAQAGTAVSTRTRGEANSWNLIRIGTPGAVPAEKAIEVQQMVWKETRFKPGRTERYSITAGEWVLDKR